MKTKDHDYGFIRLDHQINTNNRLALRYNIENARYPNQLIGNTEDGGGIGTPSGGRNLFINDQALVGTLNSALNSNVVNTLLVQWARRRYDFPGVTGEPNLDIPNNLSFGHNFGTLDALYEKRLQISDTLGWLKRQSLYEIRYRSKPCKGLDDLSRLCAGADHSAGSQLPDRFRQLCKHSRRTARWPSSRIALSFACVFQWRRSHILWRRRGENGLC